MTIKILQQFFILLYYEAKIDYRYWQNLLVNLLFLLTMMVVLQIILPKPTTAIDQLLQTIAIIIFATINNLQNCYQKFLANELEDGSLDQLILAVNHVEIIISARLIAGWIRQIIPIIIILILYLKNSNLDNIILTISYHDQENFTSSNLFYRIMATIVVASFNISLISAFCGSLSIIKTRHNNQIALATIIAIPLLLPTILIAQASIFNDFLNNFIIICSLGLLLFFLTIWAIKEIIETSR